MTHATADGHGPDLARELADAARDLFDSVVAADLRDIQLDPVVQRINQLAETFDGWQPAGGPIDPQLPGAQPHALIGRVPWSATEATANQLIGHAKFRLIHAGSTGVVHGGAISFLMDEVMGVFANSRVSGVARTAIMTVTYRRPTPVGVDLVVSARHENSDGRKQEVTATLTGDDGVVFAEAEGLFVTVNH